MQIARIFRRLAVYDSRIRGADKIIRRTGRRDFAHKFLHRLGKLVKAQRVLNHVARIFRRERFVIGKEIFRLHEINFRLFIVTAMNRVVRALEQTLFTVLGKFQRKIFIRVGGQIFQQTRRHDGGRGDIVFHLNFDGGMKIFPQTERAPRAVTVETDA